MNQPNLVCPLPDCGHQLTHRDFRNRVQDSYNEFQAEFQCPRCGGDLYPEDALLEYHRQIGCEQSAAYPLSIGGYCNLGSIELTPGYTETQSVLQGISVRVIHDRAETGRSRTETPTDIEAAQLFDPDEVDAAPPFTVHDLDGQSLRPAPGPHLIADDTVIVDVHESALNEDRTEVVFTSSILEPTDRDSVSAGYYMKYKPANLEGPPWTGFFTEGLRTAYNEHDRTAIPMLFAGFDNLIERLLFRAFKLQGREEQHIEMLLSANSGWYDMLKENMEIALGDRMTSFAPDVYRRFDDLRDYRNEGLIHVQGELEPRESFDGDAFDAFELIMEATLAIFERYRETVLTS